MPTTRNRMLHRTAVAGLRGCDEEKRTATYTAASTALSARWLFGFDAANPLSKMSAPDDYAFAPRAQQALTAVCAGLKATVPARAIADDMDGITGPTTALGQAHHAWVGERGLPGAFDDHDNF